MDLTITIYVRLQICQMFLLIFKLQRFFKHFSYKSFFVIFFLFSDLTVELLSGKN